jgi:hypothetical protein
LKKVEEVYLPSQAASQHFHLRCHLKVILANKNLTRQKRKIKKRNLPLRRLTPMNRKIMFRAMPDKCKK